MDDRSIYLFLREGTGAVLKAYRPRPLEVPFPAPRKREAFEGEFIQDARVSSVQATCSPLGRGGSYPATPVPQIMAPIYRPKQQQAQHCTSLCPNLVLLLLSEWEGEWEFRRWHERIRGRLGTVM